MLIFDICFKRVIEDGFYIVWLCLNWEVSIEFKFCVFFSGISLEGE